MGNHEFRKAAKALQARNDAIPNRGGLCLSIRDDCQDSIELSNGVTIKVRKCAGRTARLFVVVPRDVQVLRCHEDPPSKSVQS